MSVEGGQRLADGDVYPDELLGHVARNPSDEALEDGDTTTNNDTHGGM